ncbi:putative quinol monooxygenase [Streptomyces sp. KLOTTS4A1]|uniref:putative quinol monooxygenase n=1 Tax=Streptomyces sp. KLOTTS4A1 TaxID=3390996 RepID=UPI0039F584BE
MASGISETSGTPESATTTAAAPAATTATAASTTTATTTIVRVSEARVRPERFEEFRAYILAAVRGFPARYPGLVAHEVLAAPPHSLLYVSRWRGEADLVAYAGPGWREQPVMLPGEEDYLLGPLEVRHFASEPLQ